MAGCAYARALRPTNNSRDSLRAKYLASFVTGILKLFTMEASGGEFEEGPSYVLSVNKRVGE